MSDCIFCGVVSGKVPSKIVEDTPELVAFRDISPRAPTHILIIPKRHIATVNDLAPQDGELVGKMVLLARKIAAAEKVDVSGYRLIFNVNKGAGQTVFHLHLHLMGGRAMSWPPG